MLWMEENRRPWHLNPKTGGGMPMTAGIHALDRLVWLMDGEVEGISALVNTYLHDQEADDSALMFLRFADGRMGQVTSVGYRDGAVTFAMDLVCEDGTLRIDFDHGVSIGRGARWKPIANSADPNWMQRRRGRMAGHGCSDRRRYLGPRRWPLCPPHHCLPRRGPMRQSGAQGDYSVD